MSDVVTRLWERAEAAIEKELANVTSARVLARVATVAILRQLSDEVEVAEEDEVEWPDSGDLAILANNLEARVDGGS